jgi:hypothetical protein
MERGLTPEARFWKYVEISSTCWNWQGSRSRKGYGSFGFEGKIQAAHRVSWQIRFGPIPSGLYVCHHCDNPGCVRPDHLFLGTQKENMADMKRKGRADRTKKVKGEAVGNSKLNEEQVRVIRSDTRTQEAIAADYHVTPSCISFIKRRVSWRHVS